MASQVSSSKHLRDNTHPSEVKVPQSCPTLCDPMDCIGILLYSPWNSPGQNAGVGSLSLLQGIFPTQGSNPGLPHCRWILYQLSHKGSLLAIVNSAAMNIGVHVSFRIVVFSGFMPSSGIAGSYGDFYNFKDCWSGLL